MNKTIADGIERNQEASLRQSAVTLSAVLLLLVNLAASAVKEHDRKQEEKKEGTDC